MPTERVRLSLREIQYKYDSGEDRTLLENLIRAFRGIQKLEPNYNLPPEKDLSFFRIGGFHGEPFEGPGRYDPDWWGGYCHHSDVLFPAWHRAYLYHLENALRTVPGCEKVTLPFWDECWDALFDKTGMPIPSILTTPTFDLDDETHNPLYSYKLQQALVENVVDANQRYSKHKDYETVRYPLSGLVGTKEDQDHTEIHNAKFRDLPARTEILNNNVRAWLEGEVKIDKSHDDPKTRYPDTYSVLSRFKSCLEAPTYTLFSNNTSMKAYQEKHGQNPDDMVSLESPHNAIHLAVGGFYQNEVYNADPIVGANGDMGDNETAGFDPIFFFHHCFIDYVFWLWQEKHNCKTQGSLKIDPTDPGAKSIEGSVGTAPGTPLNNESPLVPFRNPNDPNGSWQTLDSITDIEKQLGYSYGTGSLEVLVKGRPEFAVPQPANFVALKATNPIDRSKYAGSFVIRTYASTPKRGKVEIGREPVLSRWNIQGCRNCLGRLTTRGITPISKELEQALLEGEDHGTKVEYHAHVEHRVFTKDQKAPFLQVGHKIDVIDL